MKHIATLPYEEVDFVWISNHYDVHLSGLCKMGNTLFWFETRILDDYENIKCDLYMLSFWEEMRLRFRKFAFEQMVGHHWSYPKRKSKGFYYRKPEWLYKILFVLYYKMKKLFLLVVLMGVLTLQSCTSYRLKIITSGEQKYYFPQKRTLIDWEDVDQEMFTDLASAELFIYNLQNSNNKQIIEYKKY